MPVTSMTLEDRREALEAARGSLAAAQLEIRQALRMSAQACTVLKDFTPALLMLLDTEADIQQRIDAVDAALRTVEGVVDDDDEQELAELLRPVMSDAVQVPAGVPAGQLLN